LKIFNQLCSAWGMLLSRSVPPLARGRQEIRLTQKRRAIVTQL